ncbi:hypothetical protein [Sporomusa sphaeroides]|uniref:Uncharacterized protein n=1 Tax=Sporomusa sphaeroides DSM 2875 TaxID=1337886 RepID=A0ABP2C8V0_9FIRM|nr:hypothetical protein [Sporomusa sphaeroides]OLS54519.1 hypothetical protein SPSPH_43040 [Sporomusa sphaeroides DSM 2875]CVK20751.1 hypothetical protein SSPH_03419 [Sporomusa sphaeroides DSM 2875]
MYCPLLCVKPENSSAFFCQCMKEACAWWIATGTTGKCAICQMGVYAANQDKTP